eukprot:623344-Pleurochrysis_carterae.AAC.3
MTAAMSEKRANELACHSSDWQRCPRVRAQRKGFTRGARSLAWVCLLELRIEARQEAHALGVIEAVDGEEDEPLLHLHRQQHLDQTVGPRERVVREQNHQALRVADVLLEPAQVAQV